MASSRSQVPVVLQRQVADYLKNQLVEIFESVKEEVYSEAQEVPGRLGFKVVPGKKSVGSGGFDPRRPNPAFGIADELIAKTRTRGDERAGAIYDAIWEVAADTLMPSRLRGNLEGDFFILMRTAVARHLVSPVEDLGRLADQTAQGYLKRCFGLPVTHSASMLCCRLWVEEDVELLPGITIRTATDEDVVTYFRAHAGRYIDPIETMSSLDWFSGVIEIDLEVHNIWQVLHQCRKLAFQLSLFRAYELNVATVLVESDDLSVVGNGSAYKLSDTKPYESNWVVSRNIRETMTSPASSSNSPSKVNSTADLFRKSLSTNTTLQSLIPLL